MSSPLEARIRTIAQEVASGLADGLPGSDRLASLEQTVAALGVRLDELEKAVTAPAPAAKRTARKTTESSE